MRLPNRPTETTPEMKEYIEKNIHLPAFEIALLMGWRKTVVASYHRSVRAKERMKDEQQWLACPITGWGK